MGLFENFPYTNFHELNLDWIIKTVQELGNDVRNFESQMQEYVYTYLNKWVNDNFLDVASLTGGSVNIAAFAPHADGKTDDSEAFNRAINFCNLHQVDLALNPSTYYIKSPLNNMTRSVDGHGATIKAGSATSAGTAIFNMEADSANYTVAAGSFKASGVTDSRLFGKVFHVVSDVDIGERGSSGYHKYAEQTITTDGLGNITNADLGFSPVTSCDVLACRTATEGRYFKNINFVCGEGTFLLGLLRATWDNLTVENICTNGVIVSTGFVGAVINLQYCSNCTVSNVTGSGVAPSNGSGYIVEISAGTNNVVRDCNLHNSSVECWGNIGCNYLTNTSFINVTSNRIDCHYMAFGYMVIDGCTPRLVSLPEGGYGDIIISNSNLISSSYGLITARSELPLKFSGNIVVRNCTIDPATNHNLITITLKDNVTPIVSNLPNYPLVISIEDCNFGQGLRELVYLYDNGYFDGNCSVNVVNTVVNVPANIPPIRMDAGTGRVACNWRGCKLMGSKCAYMGASGREDDVFEGCELLCNANTPATGVTVRMHNCTYQQSASVAVARLIVVGCYVLTTGSRNTTGTDEKLVANIASDSRFTDSWNS